VNEPRNPYSPPAAEVADAQVEGALEGQEALIPNGRVVPIGNGVRWLTNAMRLYFQQPLKWTGVVLLLGLLSFVVAFIPFFNFLTTVLWPVIGGGIMLALSLQRRTGSFTINDIFAGFGPRFGSLALVGVVMLLMYPILFASFAIFVGADIAGAVTESASARQIDPALVMTTNFLLAILVYLLFALPLLLAMPAAYAQTQSTPGNANEILEYVIVTGSQVDLTPDYAGGQVARGGRVGLFGNLDMMDTPFNSTNYTADFMRNLQARSVADVVQSDPGVRVARGFGNFQELYVVRGFPVYSDDMSYNGLYGLLPRQYVAAEFLERVEVFRGANSFLNGAAPNGSGLGGSFNLVPKRAPDQPLNRLSAGYENEGQSYLAADFARRFGGFGMRINGVRRDGEMSIDNQERELSMASLGIDYRGERARFSADFGWQDHRLDAPRPSVTPSGIGGLPRAADASSNFAQNWTFSAEKDFFGVARGEYDVTENTSVWAASGVRDSEEHNVLANPTANGDGSSSAYRFDNYREDRVTTSEIGLRTRFDTGAVGHRLSIQASHLVLEVQQPAFDE